MGKPVTLISKSAAMFLGRMHSLGPHAKGGTTAAAASATADASGFAATGGALRTGPESAGCGGPSSPQHNSAAQNAGAIAARIAFSVRTISLCDAAKRPLML
jgi:hypothetical protein